MRKFILYLALTPLVILALTPPWNFFINCEVNSLFWLWAVLISGFLVFLYLFFDVNIFLKLFLIWTYLGCFISKAPYISFTMFLSVVICAYYYLLCRRITEWDKVKKVIQALFFLMVFLIVTQLFGLDTLLNFNMPAPCILGTIGNYMILGSYICVLAPFLLVYRKLNIIPLLLVVCISRSAGAVLAIVAGTIVYLFCTLKYKLRFAILASLMLLTVYICIYQDSSVKMWKYGRGPVWKRTFELVNKRPCGYGAATYRLLFPIYSQDLKSSEATVGMWEYNNTFGNGLAWRRCHNCWLQMDFEAGHVGMFFFLPFLAFIVWRVRKIPDRLAGLAILATDMTVHFPTRMLSSVFIMICFLTYCEKGG